MSTSELPTKPKSPHMTERQWREAEVLWASGNVTYEALVAKYGKSKSAFERRFRKNKIVKGSTSEALKKAAEKRIAQEVATDATIIAERIRTTKEEHYKMAAILAKMTWGHVMRTQSNHEPLATALNEFKAIDAAINVLKKAREERYAVLGLDRPDAVDPGDLPELIVSELTAEQVRELQERDVSEFDDIPLETGESDRHSISEGDDEGDDNGVVEEGGS